MPKRMDIRAKIDMLNLIRNVLIQNPELRLGQIFHAVKNAVKGKDLSTITDKEITDAIQTKYKKEKPIDPKS